jgi:hypothetical protein
MARLFWPKAFFIVAWVNGPGLEQAANPSLAESHVHSVAEE